jgi:hypothetical protein
LFSRAAKKLEVRTKPLHFVKPCSENFEIYPQKQLNSTVFCSAAQSKTLEFTNKNNSNQLYFVLPRSEKLWNLNLQKQLKTAVFCVCRAGA